MNTTEGFLNYFGGDDKTCIKDIIVYFFDELMVLYNTIGEREDLLIDSKYNSSDSSLPVFNIKLENDDDAMKLYDNLNNRSFSVYNMNYLISMQINSNIIATTISRLV